MLCEWKDFSTETETYTLARFESLIGDEFESMQLDTDGFPKCIWTTNFVVLVTKRTKIVEEVDFTRIPRNPVCD